MQRPSTQFINKELEELGLRLENLNKKEMDFQSLLDKMEAMKQQVVIERMEAERRRYELESQKEPINWLPAELLALIFLHLIPLHREDSRIPSSIVISHVCSKWRTIALSTPALWSRAVLRGYNFDIFEAFLLRSKEVGLCLEYESLPSTSSGECDEITKLVDHLTTHLRRCEELTIRVHTARPILRSLTLFEDFTDNLQQLHHLTLSILVPDPLFVEARRLIDGEEDTMRAVGLNKSNNHSSKLRHLTLERVPLFNFAPAFVTNLRKIELAYTARSRYSTRLHYFLKLSSLCNFLSLTPRLEDLILRNTVPYFDAIPSPLDETPADLTAPQEQIRMHPVHLRYLKNIEWTYPYSSDVARFLCMLDAPHLQRIDIWMEDAPRQSEVITSRGYDPAASSRQYIRMPLSFPLVRDISIQCTEDEGSICFLRKLSFPVIENLAVTNIDSLAREGHDRALPVFPRLESVFRDPRLPHLTHLTLSHFNLSLDPAKTDGFLGYMPALTSLSFDSCKGVGKLLEFLKDMRTVVNRLDQDATCTFQAKFCPRLEAISLWKCHDVEFSCLEAIVIARNQKTSRVDCEAPADNVLLLQEVIPKAACSRYEAAGIPSAINGTPARKIKPLRRRMAAAASANHEYSEPVNIIYLRVAECDGIDGHALKSLRDVGVIDIIYVDKNH